MFKAMWSMLGVDQDVRIGTARGLLPMRQPVSSFTLSSALSFGFDLMIPDGPSIAAKCRHEGEARERHSCRAQ